jgi:uridine kinase
MPATDSQLPGLVARILRVRAAANPQRATLVAVSGIDASGKGHVAGQLDEALTREGVRVARIGIDPWLNPPLVRESPIDSGPHFYRHAFDLDRHFTALIDPLCARRAIDLRVRLGGQSGVATGHHFLFQGIDVVLLEGIFLFRRDLRARYDLRIWVECSFQSALHRALVRNQEGLPPDDIRKAYATIYIPAQHEHIRLDDPKAAADVVFDNDLAA